MGLTAVVLVVLMLAAAALWVMRPFASGLTEEVAERTVVTTVQREAAASFLVTGYLEITVSSTVRNTEVLLPGVLDLNVGTAESTVRVPGRVYYGFDIGQLEAGAVRMEEDGVVSVRLPDLQVQAAEPDLAQMEVQTKVGWMRLRDDARERVEREAVRRVQGALRTQGARHLQSSTQPRINTARALEQMLKPAFEAAGYEDVRVRIRIDGDLVLEPAR